MKNNQAIAVKDNHVLRYSYDDLEELEVIVENRYKHKINLYENAVLETHEINLKLIKEVKYLKIALAIMFLCISAMGVKLL